MILSLLACRPSRGRLPSDGRARRHVPWGTRVGKRQAVERTVISLAFPLCEPGLRKVDVGFATAHVPPVECDDLRLRRSVPALLQAEPVSRDQLVSCAREDELSTMAYAEFPSSAPFVGWPPACVSSFLYFGHGRLALRVSLEIANVFLRPGDTLSSFGHQNSPCLSGRLLAHREVMTNARRVCPGLLMIEARGRRLTTPISNRAVAGDFALHVPGKHAI